MGEGASGDGEGGFVGEVDWAILCVVDGGGNAGIGFDESLVTVGVEERNEGYGSVFGDCCVLVKLISRVCCAVCHAGAVFDSGGAVADVVVGVFIFPAADRGFR